MQTATSDQQIAELRRELGCRKQQVSRLQNELNIIRAEARRRAIEKTPKPPPAPQPDFWPESSQGAADAVASRLQELEAEVVAFRAASVRQAEELQRAAASERSLRAELQHKPHALSSTIEREIADVRAEATQLRAELEHERELRRSLQRQLLDKAKPSPRVVAAEQLQGRPRDADEEAERKNALVVSRINDLGYQISKLEKQKLNVEDALVAKVESLELTVIKLKEQLSQAHTRLAAACFEGVARPPPHDVRTMLSPRSTRASLSVTRMASVDPARKRTLCTSDAPPRSCKDCKASLTERLKALDPAAAAQYEEQHTQLMDLKARILKAQAQTAADTMNQTHGVNISPRARAHAP